MSFPLSPNRRALTAGRPVRGGRPPALLRGTEADLRAMKRALAHAPLGPKAVLALTSAILALESQRGHEA